MRIVTLTTDLGYRDHYLAIVKAKLFSQEPNLNVIDLSCEIKDNPTSNAAYIIRNSLPHFPDGTIHLVAVKWIIDKSDLNKNITIDNSRFLITKYLNQYIICPDNGLLTLIDPNFNAEVYQLYYEGENKHHFFLKDVFVDAAIHLCREKELTDIASLTNDYYKATSFNCYVSNNVLKGKGVYVDDFGNIITNITKEDFYNAIQERNFTFQLPGKGISEIKNTYDEVNLGSPLLIFNSQGFLEVAINGESAFKMLCIKEVGRKFDFNVVIEIYD